MKPSSLPNVIGVCVFFKNRYGLHLCMLLTRDAKCNEPVMNDHCFVAFLVIFEGGHNGIVFLSIAAAFVVGFNIVMAALI